jgi:hypothetical protein
MPEGIAKAGGVDDAEEVFDGRFPSDVEATEIVHPSEEPPEPSIVCESGGACGASWFLRLRQESRLRCEPLRFSARAQMLPISPGITATEMAHRLTGSAYVAIVVISTWD